MVVPVGTPAMPWGSAGDTGIAATFGASRSGASCRRRSMKLVPRYRPEVTLPGLVHVGWSVGGLYNRALL